MWNKKKDVDRDQKKIHNSNIHENGTRTWIASLVSAISMPVSLQTVINLLQGLLLTRRYICVGLTKITCKIMSSTLGIKVTYDFHKETVTKKGSRKYGYQKKETPSKLSFPRNAKITTFCKVYSKNAKALLIFFLYDE